MATKTKDEVTDLVPLESDLGSKLAASFERAEHVVVDRGGDPVEAAMAIVSNILDTTTLEESNKVFDSDGLSTRDLAGNGTVVELRSLTIRPSDYPDEDTGQRGWYGQLAGVNTDTGEAVRISTSSRTVMAQFVAADAAGLIPAQASFVEADKNERGRQPIHIEWVTKKTKKA